MVWVSDLHGFLSLLSFTFYLLKDTRRNMTKTIADFFFFFLVHSRGFYCFLKILIFYFQLNSTAIYILRSPYSNALVSTQTASRWDKIFHLDFFFVVVLAINRHRISMVIISATTCLKCPLKALERLQSFLEAFC